MRALALVVVIGICASLPQKILAVGQELSDYCKDYYVAQNSPHAQRHDGVWWYDASGAHSKSWGAEQSRRILYCDLPLEQQSDPTNEIRYWLSYNAWHNPVDPGHPIVLKAYVLKDPHPASDSFVERTFGWDLPANNAALFYGVWDLDANERTLCAHLHLREVVSRVQVVIAMVDSWGDKDHDSYSVEAHVRDMGVEAQKKDLPPGVPACNYGLADKQS